MTTPATAIKFAFAASAAMLALSACDTKSDNEATPTANAANAAGDSTIGAGLASGSKFAAAAKAAGLDATLAGPGSYTVLVPSDAAFDKLPAGALDTLMKPEGRADLTALLSYHILPGAMLGADIGKAIDQGGGKAQIPTHGGGSITATKEGERIALTDSAGTKAFVITADGKRSNGVVHEIDAVLMPTR